ncbi:hypothetical protein BN1303_03801 [Mycobacterium tuberculosis]|nr:hypothetical protein BN1303_03801 [Mycobacterium tuberculosis]
MPPWPNTPARGGRCRPPNWKRPSTPGSIATIPGRCGAAVSRPAPATYASVIPMRTPAPPRCGAGCMPPTPRCWIAGSPRWPTACARMTRAPWPSAAPTRWARWRPGRICAARITGTHRGHQGVQPRIQGLGVGGIQLGVHLAHAVRGIPDRHLPIAGPLPHLAHRIGVGHRHDPIYRGGQLPRVIDGQPRTRSASSASTRANTCGSVIKSVRYTNV